MRRASGEGPAVGGPGEQQWVSTPQASAEPSPPSAFVTEWLRAQPFVRVSSATAAAPRVQEDWTRPETVRAGKPESHTLTVTEHT